MTRQRKPQPGKGILHDALLQTFPADGPLPAIPTDPANRSLSSSTATSEPGLQSPPWRNGKTWPRLRLLSLGSLFGPRTALAPAPFDVSHSELVSTVADYHAFLRALLDGRLIGPDLRDEMRREQVQSAAKTPDSFFPGFWENIGWGYGVSVVTGGSHRGRFGWSGGLGTDFFVDPDGTICIVMTQIEMDARIFALLGELQGLSGA